MLRQRLTTWPKIRDVLESHSRRGRDGCGRLRSLLEERYGDAQVPDSAWNRLVGRLLVAHGLPEPAYEFRVVTTSGRALARVDLAYPEAELAIECDSVRYHLNRESFVKDRRRANALTTAGWTVLSFTWRDFKDEPLRVVETVFAALRQAEIAAASGS